MDSGENIALLWTLCSHNDTAEVGLATVRAFASLEVLDSMIHHLLDRRSVEDKGVVRGLLLVALLDGALGVEALGFEVLGLDFLVLGGLKVLVEVVLVLGGAEVRDVAVHAVWVRQEILRTVC